MPICQWKVEVKEQKWEFELGETLVRSANADSDLTGQSSTLNLSRVPVSLQGLTYIFKNVAKSIECIR